MDTHSLATDFEHAIENFKQVENGQRLSFVSIALDQLVNGLVFREKRLGLEAKFIESG